MVTFKYDFRADHSHFKQYQEKAPLATRAICVSNLLADEQKDRRCYYSAINII